MSATARVRHWWSGNHAPYPNQLHDIDTDAPRNMREIIEQLIEEANVADGEVITITVEATGFVDNQNHWELIEPHVYAKVEGNSPRPHWTAERALMRRRAV